MVLVDTDILVDVRRGYEPAVEWLDSLPDSPVLPRYVAMELYAGCRNRAEASSMTEFLEDVQVYWLDASGCDRALAVFPDLRLQYGLGVLDVLIGQCALELDAPLCTFNTRHFRGIPGLRLEQPYTR